MTDTQLLSHAYLYVLLHWKCSQVVTESNQFIMISKGV